MQRYSATGVVNPAVLAKRWLSSQLRRVASTSARPAVTCGCPGKVGEAVIPLRQATASVIVSDGTTNFTPEPALVTTGIARLGAIKVGEVEIIHQ